MKKYILFTVLAALTVLSLTGCVRAPFVPPQGMAFSQISAPLDIDYDETQLAGMKKGSAEVITILGLVSTGDASAKKAAENGGISTIVHADYDYYNVIGVYQRTTVTVYGK